MGRGLGIQAASKLSSMRVERSMIKGRVTKRGMQAKRATLNSVQVVADRFLFGTMRRSYIVAAIIDCVFVSKRRAYFQTRL
jgi:hypothetical protein